MKNFYQLLLILAVILPSCADETAEIHVERDKIPSRLTSSKLIAVRDAQQIRMYVGAASLEVPVDELKYDVRQYRVEYLTTYKGQQITASGIVLVPDTQEPVSLLGYQHSTIASNAEAPSQLRTTDHQLILYQALSSGGFVVMIPDYIGFGSSLEIMHPYYVEDLTASSIVDNLYAGKNLAEELEVKLTDRLYLAGYSQGGYATMAVHKYIEQQGIVGLELESSFAAAGGYDVYGMETYFFQQEVYKQPFFLAYVAEAYRQTFNLSTDLSYYFNEPYASQIPDLFSGELSGGEINDYLNDTIKVLVHADFIQSGSSDERYQSMNNALKDNSLLDWAPQLPLHLYHGDEDTSVPYQNSIETYNRLIANGASRNALTLTPLPGAEHSSGFLPFHEKFLTELIVKVRGRNL